MGRYNTGAYGRVGGRRSGGGAWQWAIIGLILGLGCAAVFVLALLTIGVLNLDGLATDEPGVALQNTSLPQPTANVQATVDVIVNATLAAQPSPATPTTAPTQPPQAIAPPTATPLPSNTPQLPNTEVPLSQQQNLPAAATDADQTTPEGQEARPATDSGADTAILQPQETVTEGGLPPELAGVPSDVGRVEGGAFIMGTTAQEVAVAVRECTDRDGASCIPEYGEDSYPAHEVVLDAFEMEITEVSNAQYVAFLNLMGPLSHENGCAGRQCVETSREDPNSAIIFDSLNYDVASPIFENLPVVNVTWYGAQAYCEAIGRRLPTEAEWERAARGDDGRRYPWGDEWDVSYARTNRPDPADVGVVEIRSYPVNVSPYGMVDMAGNAAEWVFDYYGENYYAQQPAGVLNPTGPASGTDRVIRGGGWDTPPFFSRTVHRQHTRPDETFLWLGFRCAQDIDPNAAVPGNPVDPSGLGPLTEGLTDDDALQPTEAEIDAAPELPPLPTIAPSTGVTATEAPAVPPGGEG